LWDTTELKEGDGGYELKIRAHDTKEGASPLVSVFFEVYNPDAPKFIDFLAPSGDLTGSGTFTWTASDPDPEESLLLNVNIYYSADKVTWEPLETGIPNTGNYVWNVIGIPDGTYALKIEVPDPTDPELKTSHIFDNIVVNNPDAPMVEFTGSPNNGDNVTGEITFAWEGSDPDGDGLTYSLYYRKFGDEQWIPFKAAYDGTTFTWNTSALTTGNYQIKVLARDDSKSHLEGEDVIGPFEIYVPKKTTGGDDPQDPIDEDPVDNGNDSSAMLIVAVVVLFLLLIVVIGLVAVVMMRKKAPQAPLPPPGGMTGPGQIPASGQASLPPPSMGSGKLQ